MKIIEKVKSYIDKNNLLQEGDSLLVAVSGGADSMALMTILHHLRHALGVDLSVAHFDHRLRKGSKRDRKFVEKMSGELGIDCFTGICKKKKSKQKGSLEEFARDCRMDFFVKLANKKRIDKIALAHTKDDLAETVLMKILRGSGLKGSRGILPKRNIQNTCFIRPFLDIERKDIEHFLKKKRVLFRVDPTNKQTKYYRNKVRLKLLPMLQKDFNRQIKNILANYSHTVSIDYDYIEMNSKRIYKNVVTSSNNSRIVKVHLPRLKKEHVALQRMVIRFAIEQIMGHTKRLTLNHSRQIEDLIHSKDERSTIHLPFKLHAQKNSSYLKLYRKNSRR